MTKKEEIAAAVDCLRKINETIHCPDTEGEKFATGIRQQIEAVAVKFETIAASIVP